MSDAREQEYEDLLMEVAEMAHTGDIDSEAYRTKKSRLESLAAELGIVNDPGEE